MLWDKFGGGDHADDDWSLHSGVQRISHRAEHAMKTGEAHGARRGPELYPRATIIKPNTMAVLFEPTNCYI